MKSLDNPIKRFASLTGKIVVLFLLILIIFGFLYNYSTIKTYNLILFILILLTIVLMLYYSVLSLAVIYVYKHRDAGKLILYIARVGLKVLLPQIIFFEGMHKNSKDSIRKFYVKLNNILVSKTGSKFVPEDILVLFPIVYSIPNVGIKLQTMFKTVRDVAGAPSAK